MSKLIHAASLAGFKTAFPYWANTDTDATNPNSSYKSIVYTDDGYLYTHGKIFQLAVTNAGAPASWFTASLSGQTLTLSSAGTTQTVTLPVVGLTTGTTTELIVTSSAGVFNINHKNDYLGAVTSVGPGAVSNTTINVPYLTATTSGHVDVLGQYTATLNHVLQTLDTTTATSYLLFGTSATSVTSGSIFNTSLKANMSNGSLYATTFYENGTSLAAKYAAIGHTSVVGSDTVLGHVKLSDSITDSTNGVANGIAATPKAVKAAYDSLKTYADGLLGANDAMVFKGTLGTGGTVTALPTSGYSAGWTYRVITAATYAGVACEVGDLIICVKDYATAFANSDWTVAQTTVDGAVTSSAALTVNQLVVGGTASTAVKTLSAGTDGQVLTMASGIPAWTANQVRPISVNDTSILNATTYTALNLKGSTNITVSSSGGDVTFSATGLVTTASLANLTFSGTDLSSTAQTWVYGPTFAKTVTLDSDLYLTSAGHIGHRNQITAQGTQAVYSFKYDANGHIIGTPTAVTSMPSPTNLAIAIGGGTTEGTTLYTYNGSTAKSLNIIAGSNVSFTTAAGSLTINSSYSNTVSALAIGATGTTTSAATTNGNTYLKLVNSGVLTNSFKIFGSGATSVISNASGNIEVNSVNSWRNVTAYLLSTNTSGQVLSNSIATADLDFGSEFLWDATGGSGNDGQLRIGWAEIATDGTITYAV